MTTLTDQIGALVESMPDDAKIELTVGDVKRMLMLARSALLLDRHSADIERKLERVVQVVESTCEAISQTSLPASMLPFPSCGSYAPARVQQDIEADFIDASAIAWSHVMRQQMPPRLAGHWLEESARRISYLGRLWRHACRGCAGKGKSRRRLLRAIMAAAVRELGR